MSEEKLVKARRTIAQEHLKKNNNCIISLAPWDQNRNKSELARDICTVSNVKYAWLGSDLTPLLG